MMTFGCSTGLSRLKGIPKESEPRSSCRASWRKKATDGRLPLGFHFGGRTHAPDTHALTTSENRRAAGERKPYERTVRICYQKGKNCTVSGRDMLTDSPIHSQPGPARERKLQGGGHLVPVSLARGLGFHFGDRT